MSSTAASDSYAPRDPRSAHPGPPFPRQPQTAPGDERRMDPPADHGEASYRGAGRLSGRRALVTGADSGIGRAVAIAFAREGADVAISHLSEEETDARATATLVEAAGRKAVLLPGDISEEAFCGRLVADAVAGLGGLDILVNNAGKQTAVDAIADLTTEQFDATFRTNVYALFWITKAALPHMQPGSAIINTTSIQAMQPSASLLDYAPTKAAILSFTKALAKQVMERGVRVNAVAPGPFWTPLQPSGGQPQEKVETFGKETVFGRPGQPAELAAAYVLLASQEASYMTGECIGATGGMTPY